MGRARPAKDSESLEFLTTEQLAALLHISERTVKQWRSDGIGPKWRRVGRRILYKRSDVERWFDSQSV